MDRDDQRDLHSCAKCGNQTDNRSWAIEGIQFHLCETCNPQLCRLVKDWVAIGLLQIPEKEFLK